MVLTFKIKDDSSHRFKRIKLPMVNPIAATSFLYSVSLNKMTLKTDINKIDPALYAGKTIAAGKTSSAFNKKKDANKFGMPIKLPMTRACPFLSGLLSPIIYCIKLSKKAVAKTIKRNTGLYSSDTNR